MENDERALLDRWCDGDGAAGNALLKQHFTAVYRFFKNKVDSDVDELVQETFLGCVRQRDHFRRQSSFRTYLFAIARNRLYDYWRHRAARGADLDVHECSVARLSTSAGGRLIRHDDRQRLLAALRTLPLELQVLLELHYWDGLDSDQLAEIFEIEPPTVRTRMFRARQLLREQLEDTAGEPTPPSSADGLDAWARALRPDPP